MTPEEFLREEMRLAKQRWSPEYSQLSAERQLELAEEKKARRLAAEAEIDAAAKQAAEEIPTDCGHPSDSDGPFRHGTGGGRRIIRDPRGLGG